MTDAEKYKELRKALERELTAAERQIHDSAKSLRSQIDSVLGCLTHNRMLNSLGELQGTVSKFESAVGAAARLKQALGVLED